MSESKHTPGPWSVSRNAYGTVFVNGGEPHTTPVGTAYRMLVAGGNNHDTLTLANARLIAAAPDMLEALKFARGAVYENEHFADVAEVIDAVIAKAEGHQ